MLQNYNFKVIEELEFPDHYKYNYEDINKILSKAKDLNCTILTTEKDYMRLNNKIFKITMNDAIPTKKPKVLKNTLKNAIFLRYHNF